MRWRWLLSWHNPLNPWCLVVLWLRNNCKVIWKRCSFVNALKRTGMLYLPVWGDVECGAHGVFLMEWMKKTMWGWWWWELLLLSRYSVFLLLISYACGCWRIWVGFDLTWCCGTRVCCTMKFHCLHYIEHVQAPTLKTNVCEAWISSSRNNRCPGRTKILWNLWCLSCRQILTPIGRNVLVLLGIDISTRTSTTQLWGIHRSDRAERAHWFSKCLASGECQQKDFAMMCCLETNRLKKESPVNCGYVHVFGCFWLQAFSRHHSCTLVIIGASGSCPKWSMKALSAPHERSIIWPLIYLTYQLMSLLPNS